MTGGRGGRVSARRKNSFAFSLPYVKRTIRDKGMPRLSFLEDPIGTNLHIERSLYDVARKTAKANRINSFAEYISRLIVADALRKTSVAPSTPRSLPAGRN